MRVRVAHPIVGDDQEPRQLARFGPDAEDHALAQRPEHRGRREDRLRQSRLCGLPCRAALVHFARNLLENDRALGGVIEKRSRCGQLDARRHLGPEPGGEIESAASLVEQVQRRRRCMARTLDRGEHHLAELVGLEHVHQRATRVGDRGVQVEALAEKDRLNLTLDPKTKRLEENQDDDRREDRVQIDGVEAAEVGDEQRRRCPPRETRARSRP